MSVYLVWFLNYLEAPKKEHFSLRIWFQNSDFKLLKRSNVKADGRLEKLFPYVISRDLLFFSPFICFILFRKWGGEQDTLGG